MRAPRPTLTVRAEVGGEPIDLAAWARLYVRTVMAANAANAHVSQNFPEAS